MIVYTRPALSLLSFRYFFQSLIYGEVEFASFYRVLRKINPAPGLVFYDLGEG